MKAIRRILSPGFAYFLFLSVAYAGFCPKAHAGDADECKLGVSSSLIPCDATNNCTLSNAPVTLATGDSYVGPNGIQVQDWGNASAPKVVIFIHGYPHSHIIWANQIKYLDKNKYRVVTIDVRGQGASYKPVCKGICPDPVVGYHSGDFADDIKAVITSLGLPAAGKKIYLVGHSYGGWVINDYLFKHGTADIAAVTYVGTSGILIGPPTPAACGGGFYGGPVFLNNFPNMISSDIALQISGINAFGAGGFLFPNLFPKIRPEIGMTDMAVPTEVSLALATRILPGPAESIVQPSFFTTLNKPALFIFGASDQVLLPGAATCAAALMPAGLATVKLFQYSAHFPQFERPILFNATLKSFLDAN